MKKILIILLLMFINIKNIYAVDTSKSAIVMDIDNGRILYQKNSNNQMLIASTTKLMTFLTALKLNNNFIDDTVTVGDEVLKMYGTSMYLSIGEKLTLRDLLYGLILRSGNDASVVISKYLSNDINSFVNQMNNIAKNIGMLNTNFKNPHGLDDDTKNYSTAYDLAILIRYLYLNYPIFREIAGSKYYNFKSNLKSYELINRSKIMFTYKYITSAKNGYTPLAGKSLVTTASKDNLNLLIVTLDDFDIYSNHERLYEYYFSLYKNYLIIDKDNYNISSLNNKNYYLKNSFYYPLTVKEEKQIKTNILLEDKNDTFGKVQILLNDKIIHEEIIYKKKLETKKESIWKKFIKIFKIN